ncbi:hypothetical protein ACJIZ3_017016 [Penstemon smallii]|uniref:Uncharacterized protein n=1 Tax=Penstemon smallii TaxID=265156 RepID=A0ABD3SUD9_9LAMI
MDTYEATKIVMSRIQSLDPDNASKIMGYILIQDQGEKEMIRLAFVPETLLISYMNQAKACLGLVSNTSSTNPIPINNPFPQASPRILIPNNGFHHLSSPRSSPRPISYASVLNGSNSGPNNGSGSSNLNFYGGNDFGDEFLSGGGVNHHHQVQDQLSFFDDSMVNPIMSPSGRSDSLVFPYGGDDLNNISSPHPHHPFHRRSCSVNDAAFLSNLEEMGGGGGGGFGWRPCMYFNRGFCKNGSTCKFLHNDIGETIEMGSPSKDVSGFDEFLRMKALQQQRFALMASGGHNPFSHSKYMNFMNENPRNDFSPMGLGGGASSSSRQIYLTFPADSTFKEEDVSGYFSMFGPVQDVRIPYQQKRMFGFVTFVFPETVKLILAKGNPHFVCDSRVLVKPYKEKGKVCERKQQLHNLERGEYSDCLSPSGTESREQFDLPFASPRMLMNTQEMMLRKKMEHEVELQHAIELQGRRIMNLQLMDMKNQHRNHPHFLPSFLTGGPISSPRLMNQNTNLSSDVSNQEVSEEFDSVKEESKSPDDEKLNENNTDNKQQHVNANDSDLPESLEHILPENLFASPTKSAAEKESFFSQSSVDANDNNLPATNTSSNNTSSLPSSSPLKSCYFQMPSH